MSQDPADPSAPDGKRRKPSAKAKTREYLPAEERVRRIRLAAQEVFARTGLKGTRTRDLAAAAKVNQATIFSHYATKADIFADAVLEPLREMMAGMYKSSDTFQHAGTPEALQKAAEEACKRLLVDTFKAHPLLTIALFSDSEEGATFYRDHVFPMIEERARVIEPTLPDSIDSGFASLVIFGILFAIAMDCTYRGIAPDMDELARKMARVTMAGFSPMAGGTRSGEP